MAVSKRFGVPNRFTVRVQQTAGGKVTKTQTYTVHTSDDFEQVTSVVESALENTYGEPTEEEAEPEPEPEPVPVRARKRKV